MTVLHSRSLGSSVKEHVSLIVSQLHKVLQVCIRASLQVIWLSASTATGADTRGRTVPKLMAMLPHCRQGSTICMLPVFMSELPSNALRAHQVHSCPHKP